MRQHAAVTEARAGGPPDQMGTDQKEMLIALRAFVSDSIRRPYEADTLYEPPYVIGYIRDTPYDMYRNVETQLKGHFDPKIALKLPMVRVQITI